MCVRAEVVVLSAGLQFYLAINDITNLVFNCPVNLLLATIFKASLTLFMLETISNSNNGLWDKEALFWHGKETPA